MAFVFQTSNYSLYTVGAWLHCNPNGEADHLKALELVVHLAVLQSRLA